MNLKTYLESIIEHAYNEEDEKLKVIDDDKSFKQKIKDKHIVEKYYRIMLQKAQDFDEKLFKQYHKAYVYLSNNDSDFLMTISKIMNSSKDADTKWNEYKSCIKQKIEEWNKRHAWNKRNADALINIKQIINK